MHKNDTKTHINNLLTKSMKESESNRLPNSSNASYNIYSESWAATIAVDIVKFKDDVVKGYKRWATINIMQAFTSTIIKIGKENSNFISAYTNGDQVILNFATPAQSNTEGVYNTAIEINSAINIMMPKILVKNNYNKPFKVGIGIWMSNNNSLIKYGEKGSSEENFTTLVGDSINYATALSDIANRNGKAQILMNHTVYVNLVSEAVNKSWINVASLTSNEISKNSLPGETIYGSSVRYTNYGEEI